MRTIKVGRYLVNLTHEETVFFPESKITKGGLIAYYQKIASVMLPYTKDRLLTMNRFPKGIAEQGFYHKDAPDFFPPWIKRVGVMRQDEQKMVHYVVCNNAATLVYLANYGCVTPHLWLSKIDALHTPDRIIFDLDPAEVGFASVQKGALILRELLQSVALEPFVMTTGSRGVHLVVPIARKHDFDEVRTLVYDIARVAVAHYPELFTLEMHKEKRVGHIFLDTLRNAYGATGVAPYAVRAREKAPVATPISWDEVDDKKLTPTRYTIANVFDRLKKLEHDPWHAMVHTTSSVAQARKKVDLLLKKYELAKEKE